MESREIKVKKINNIEIKPIKFAKPPDNRPVRGGEMISECFANIFICARKMSGKSTIIFNILEQCMGPETIIVCFCSTLNKDPAYHEMQKKYKDRFMGFTSIVDEDTGQDILEEFVQDRMDEAKIEAEEKKKKEEEESEITEKPIKIKPGVIDFGEVTIKEKKEKKSKYQEPEYIIIFDDMTSDLKNKNIARLMKRNRHFKCKVIISAHNFSDLLPDARRQVDMFILMGGFSNVYLEKLYKEALIHVPFEKFVQLYETATKEKFHFLFINTRTNSFRIDFDKEIII